MFDTSKYTIEEFMNCTFFLGASSKFDKDLETVKRILSKDPESITAAERFQLIMIYQTSYHDSGKIEGIMSFDSSCHGCPFCNDARRAAANDPTIICRYCYDHKQEETRVNVINRHQLNMLIMSTVEFTEEELSLVPVSVLNRVNSSGDCPNEIYAVNMLRLSGLHLSVNFAMWAKNAKPVQAACERIGKPDNMTLIYSSMRINHVCAIPKWFDHVFVVAADKESVKRFLALPNAGECNGKKCRECGYKCYTKAWKTGTVIIEYLRGVNPSVRKAIVAACKAREEK